MLTIIGGTYFENCQEPISNELYGSGLRAACALKNLNQKIEFISCISKKDVDLAQLICKSYKVEAAYSFIETTVSFNYYHPLSAPFFYPADVEEYKIALPEISAENVLYYGMIEASAKVVCSYAVYDPQNGISFHATGSKADHLALILNQYEALTLSGLTIKEGLQKIGEFLLQKEKADIVVIKNGSKGALVVEQEGTTLIPIFETSAVWPIGSGDIFSAAFAWQWMIEKKSASKAALIASQYTAFYCQNKVLPLPISLDGFKPLPIKDDHKIYLAGPFFNIAERWLINETRRILISFGNKVFSPLHDVGFGNSEEIASKDIDGLRSSDVILAIINGLDAGTLFEIGYAISLNKKVVVLAENVKDADLVMLIGSGCEITTDFSTAIYKASW